MQTTIYKKQIAFIPLMAGALVLAGCTNGDYDFNEVDSTLGIGGKEIVLPVSSTDLILLDDVLDIDDTECVKLDENKNYVFYREGGDVTGTSEYRPDHHQSEWRARQPHRAVCTIVDGQGPRCQGRSTRVGGSGRGRAEPFRI